MIWIEYLQHTIKHELSIQIKSNRPLKWDSYLKRVAVRMILMKIKVVEMYDHITNLFHKNSKTFYKEGREDIDHTNNGIELRIQNWKESYHTVLFIFPKDRLDAIHYRVTECILY